MAEHLTVAVRAAAGRRDARQPDHPRRGQRLLRRGAARRVLGGRHGGCPAGLADLLLARIERLSRAAQQVLRAAAVTGRRVDDELVRQASGLAAPEYDDAVREAVAHQLLVPDGEQRVLRSGTRCCARPSTPTCCPASGPGCTRRLAELLADERRLAEVPGTAAELAHHSLASHDIPGAFAASVSAGQEAERLAAPAEAHRHYDQALSLWERVARPGDADAG